MQKTLIAGLAAFIVVAASAGSAAATISAATATNCGGKADAELTSGDVVTVNLTIAANTNTPYGTVLSDSGPTTYYSNIDEREYVGGVPQQVSYTLNQAPAGAFYAYDGDNEVLLTCPAQAAAVPTMSEWAMILLGFMLAGGAALYIERRRKFA